MERTSPRRWVRRSAQEWRTLLAQYEQSGLGVAAFCERAGISPASLHRWRGLLAAEAEPAPAFVDLGNLGASSPASGAERLELRLELGAGLTLTLVRG
jgi:transposase-like protein